jgi:restriction endonuclease S subunit
MIRFTPSPSSSDKPLQANDVVFLSRGQKNFAFSLPDLPHPTFASSYFFVLRPEAKITGPYLAWCLNQPAAQRHFAKLGTTGAHMPIITRDVIETLKVPLPDLETQQRVAELDSLAVTQARLLAELARKKRALVNAACQHAISK